jgi:hypothetical protein
MMMAMAHMPTAPDNTAPCYFDKAMHERFVPNKSINDPDINSPDAPPLAIRITQFPGGGTAIGVLVMHAVCDAEAIIVFMRNWAQVFRGAALDPQPSHDRAAVLRLPVDAAVDPAKEAAYFLTKFGVTPVADHAPPPFAPVMPTIMGSRACIVSLSKNTLVAWKEKASTGLPDGKFVSTDDVVTARVWQAACAVRCRQLGIATDSGKPTTLLRALNVRTRTQPPLGAGFIGNGSPRPGRR